MAPLGRTLSLYRWLVDEFFLAGPAAFFATMYFSPNAGRRRLVKHLRSHERGRAVAGVRNAAWDMTYLSDFVRRVGRTVEEGRYYVFATADRSLARIATAMVLDADRGDGRVEYARRLSDWWPECDAATIAGELLSHVERVEGRPPPGPGPGATGRLEDLVREGAARGRAWRPA